MKKSRWKLQNLTYRATAKNVPLAYTLMVKDEGKRFEVSVGLRKQVLTVASEMINSKIGQFFLTKKLGSAIHSKKLKGKAKKR